MTKSPAYQWYPKDVLSSQRVALMDLKEEGAYRRALDFCWLYGSIPADVGKLSRLIGKGCTTSIAKAVKTMFSIHPDDPELLIHDRLELEREKQKKFADKQREIANKRWGKNDKPSEYQNDATALPREYQNDALQFSTPVLDTIVSNSSNVQTPKNPESKNLKKEKKSSSAARKIFVAPDLSEVLNYFRELKSFDWTDQWIVQQATKYFDYYTANGWRVGRNPMKDWKASVRNWTKNDFDNASINQNKHSNHQQRTANNQPAGRGGTLAELDALKRNRNSGADEQSEFTQIEIIE